MITTFAGIETRPLMGLRRQTSGTVAFDAALVAKYDHCTHCGTKAAVRALWGAPVDVRGFGLVCIAVCPACRTRWPRLAAVVAAMLEERYGP